VGPSREHIGAIETSDEPSQAGGTHIEGKQSTSFLDTRFGKTHVIASGNPASPPLVLLHPMGAGGFV
jgi:hypothetical protein